MPGIRNPLMTNGVAVVTAPVDIDITTAEQLRTVLLDAGSHGHVTVVVDMTQTRFCDCSGLSVLIRAHRRALAEGGELQRPVAKVLALLGTDQMITIRGGTEATSGSAGTQD